MIQRLRGIIIIGLLIIMSVPGYGQIAEITGRVVANGDVENIHVINRTANRFTTTNSNGYFQITVSYKDTLQFTSVRYNRKIQVVNYKNIQDQEMTVYLEENVNILDEVIVGRILTGKLDSDIENSQAERPIDFYDLGLPGYTGKPLTQSQRRLAEARKAQPGVIPILPLINAISGRTKMLKERVILERQSDLIRSIKERLSDDFFSTHPLEKKYHEEFFLYCSEDEKFEERCLGKADIQILEFLDEKYFTYLENLNSARD
ncbi:MAG: carboxypeptidase-like regulatory domain-containing protein [Bacteroidia bacterium]|nr:carboxypeptidase-like regulatory domain-containing protein [Bacteroidia bacterium]MBT8268582.1 carboxypeptidase-like regulatory domain-containing protein [Bacteroidia bacterium]NNK69613.1 hypothetical protein [Flavobacteriaceae bacterium]NNL79719.1 hypothetical protein [Flavobacteriaceae bacterium]